MVMMGALEKMMEGKILANKFLGCGSPLCVRIANTIKERMFKVYIMWKICPVLVGYLLIWRWLCTQVM